MEGKMMKNNIRLYKIISAKAAVMILTLVMLMAVTPASALAAAIANMHTFWEADRLQFRFSFNTTGNATEAGIAFTSRIGELEFRQPVWSSCGTVGFSLSRADASELWTLGKTYNWLAFMTVNGQYIESPRQVLDTQRWTVEADNSEYEPHIRIKTIMERINGFNPQSVVVHHAAEHTDASLSRAIKSRRNIHHMVEGQYVVLHLPHHIWVQIDNPKEKIDAIDFMYKAQLELLGRSEPFMPHKLLYLTNYHEPAFMYMASDHCGFSLDGAEYALQMWRQNGFPSWGIGHEIGHYMEIFGTGMLHEAHSGESWSNILNIYSFYKLGHYEWARAYVSQYASQYYGADGRYSRFEGRDFDTLRHNERSASILEANTHIFVKLPVLLIDYYGWDGMRRFFTNMSDDFANGSVASPHMQNRIDYKVTALSLAYGMDLSALFDHWTLPPSNAARARIAHLPPERIIAASYGIRIP